MSARVARTEHAGRPKGERAQQAKDLLTSTLDPITRPLARLGLRKSAIDRAAEPPLSPWAPIDLDDDAVVTQVLQLALDIADVLLSSGEGAADTALQAQSVAASFGLPHATAEVTFTSLTMAVGRRPGRPPVSAIKVVQYRTIDLTRMMRITALIDRIIRREVTLERATQEVEEINKAPHPYGFNLAITGWSLLAAGVVTQFGGQPLSAGLAFVSVFLTMWVNRLLSNAGLPVFFQQFVGGFIAGGVALSAYEILQDTSFDVRPSQIVAAGIIVLLAGLTLVGAIEDAITGYPVTSAGRIVETMMLTGGIVGGIAAAMALIARFGVETPQINPTIYGTAPFVVSFFAAGIGAAGFALASYATKSAILLSGVVGAISYSVYALSTDLDLGAIVGSGLAAMVAGLIGGILARLFGIPTVVVTIAGVAPLLPGLSLYRGLAGLLSDDASSALQQLFQAGGTAVALAAGIVFGEWITRAMRKTQATDLSIG
ncbi:threonine/serine ThrE exporter family protein [Dietzia sp.]|uniref:threonine/serine ThrE exporter family protein n=1 Tax=Dietzia sp. TaxID=1871616 RepID=UPI002FD929D0